MNPEIKSYTNEATWLESTYLLWKKIENSLSTYNSKILGLLEKWMYDEKKSINISTTEELKKLYEITTNKELKKEIEKSFWKERDFLDKALKIWDIKETQDWKYLIEITDKNYELYDEILNSFLEQYIWTDYIWRELKWKNNPPKWHVFTLNKSEDWVFHIASMEMKF